MADITIDIPPLYSAEDSGTTSLVVESSGDVGSGGGAGGTISGNAYIDAILTNETLDDYIKTAFSELSDRGNWDKKVWFKNGWFGNKWIIKFNEFEELKMLIVNREPRTSRG